MLRCSVKIKSVHGIIFSIEGCRSSYNSYNKLDSKINRNEEVIGDVDIDMISTLLGNTDERTKFLRHIQVQMIINMPRYMWQEIREYRHGFETQSESTMHTITKRMLSQSDFVEDIDNNLLILLNKHIDKYNFTDNKSEKLKAFRNIKIHLPEGFLQKRYVTTNYQTLIRIYFQRRNHRLEEWKVFTKMLLKLPYFESFIETINKKM